MALKTKKKRILWAIVHTNFRLHFLPNNHPKTSLMITKNFLNKFNILTLIPS